MNETLIARRPHHVHPCIESARLILVVRNFSRTASHIGLAVTATCTMKVLRRNGIHAEVWSVFDTAELRERVRKASKEPRPPTHVVVSAPTWVTPDDFRGLCRRFPEVEFVQLNHSGTAYLSIDHHGMKHIRQCIDMEGLNHNMRVAFNNPRGAGWADAAFGGGSLLLPNLYDTDSFVSPAAPRLDHDPLRIGSFGAPRAWKNQLTAAEAAVALAKRLGVDLELYVNVGRPEKLTGGVRLAESRNELFDGLPGCKLIEVSWAKWAQFRRIVRTMDVLFSPSFDETFNVVTADGIAEGVPSVVTGAMEWCPRAWMCEPWDPMSVVSIAMGMLHDRHSVHEARRLLRRHVDAGVVAWTRYLTRAR